MAFCYFHHTEAVDWVETLKPEPQYTRPQTLSAHSQKSSWFPFPGLCHPPAFITREADSTFLAGKSAQQITHPKANTKQ